MISLSHPIFFDAVVLLSLCFISVFRLSPESDTEGSNSKSCESHAFPTERRKSVR